MKLAFVASFLVATVLTRDARADREPIFPIDVAVTSDESGAVVDRAWIDRELAAAERIYAPFGFHVRVSRVHALGTELARIEDPRMRDRFAPLVTPHEISIFIVRSLRDNVDVNLYRNGVTWDSIPSTQNGASRRFIIVASKAGESTLAHELGHFFGLQHSPVKNNLMSYDRDGGTVFLDATQRAIAIRTATALRTSGGITITDWVTP